MTSFEITVIIASYNFNYQKLMSTLKSVVMQRDVDLEIIIADDGSQDADYSEAERYIHEIGYESFFIVKNKVNQGTVKNLLSGLKRARGKYVYMTFPGDILFDDLVLHDFYEYAEENNSKVLFGDAVYYSNDDELRLYTDKSAPLRPFCYIPERNRNFKKTAFYFGGYILGASFFRETETAKRYFSMIEDCCKYAEDNTTTAFMLADGIDVEYFSRNMIWYEYSGDISSSKENEWREVLEADFKKCFEKLKEHYPEDKIIDTAYEKQVKQKGTLSLIIKHPLVLFNALRYRMMNKRRVNYTDADRSRLEKLLKV